MPAPYLRGNEPPAPSRRGKLVQMLYGEAHPNRHLQLFWFKGNGPVFHYHILRQTMFFSSIYLAAVVVRFGKIAWQLHPVLPFLLVALPLVLVFHTIMHYLNQLCVVTSIGTMRDQVALRESLIKAKTLKIMHALRMLKQMRLAINSSLRDRMKELEHGLGFEGLRMNELRNMFESADSDNSGKLSGAEIKAMVNSVAAQPGEEDKDVQRHLDSIQDDWEFSFDDFLSMVKDVEGGEGDSVEELVNHVFGMLDQDDTGAITVHEFIGMLCGPEPNKEDQESALVILQEADTDGDGLVDREELTQLLIKYSEHGEMDEEMERVRNSGENNIRNRGNRERRREVGA